MQHKNLDEQKDKMSQMSMGIEPLLSSFYNKTNFASKQERAVFFH